MFATRNAGKIVELRELLSAFDIEVLGVADVREPVPEVIEDGETFAANAIKKARSVSRATGLPALADDSGLEVDALGGAPGVFSARYAGAAASDDDNNRKLLAALRDVPDAERGARFRSVLAFADVTGALGDDVITSDGTCEGWIVRSGRGTGGFGYDPLFFCPELGVTFAEADVGAKNGVSHRARAMLTMKPRLMRYFQLASASVSG